MFVTLVLFGLLIILYKKWIEIFNYWQSKGIPSMEGHFPYGADIESLRTRTYVGHIVDKVYKKGVAHPYYGSYDVRVPFLVLRDPDIIRLVLTKEFSHFRDRNGLEIPKEDPLAHHLFSLEGERWRALRMKLSPTFTSGKMKAMFPLFIACAEALDSVLSKNDGKTMDMKDISTRFTTDVICTCAFGLDVNSTRNEGSEFAKIGSKFFESIRSNILIINFVKLHPDVVNYFNIRFTDRKIEKFIMKVVKETVEHREKENLRRNDFLDLLIQLKNNKLPIEEDTIDSDHESLGKSFELTMELLAAQCFVFLLAGLETSSSVQAYCLYELALNPKIQERLQREIDEVLGKHDGLTYQAIHEMQYLDMVISETMRKYPTLPFLSRRCTKTFTLPTGHRLDKGDRVVIPVWSLHHDPEYFPDPDEFDPERFSEESKSSIRPFTYLPFGEGPRICIGMRFGLLQTKVGLITILRRFQVKQTEKTPTGLKFWGGSIISISKTPIDLKITKRERRANS